MSRLDDIAADINGTPKPLRPLFKAHSEMKVETPNMKPELIHGMLRRSEIMNIIGAPKTGKSWFVNDLALSMAAGVAWIGHYPLTRGRVLLIDNELHPETITFRLSAVARGRGMALSDYDENLRVESLRGRLSDIEAMASYFDEIGPDQFDLIILDAWYRMIPVGRDENSNSDMTSLYNVLDRYAAVTNAAFALIHHTSKGSQADKAVTDVGSGAGAQSRACDTHLTLRAHQEDDAVVLHGVVRSNACLMPAGMRWNADEKAWRVDPHLDVSRLRAAKPPKEKAVDAPEPADEAWTPQRFVESFITAEPQAKSLVLAAARNAPQMSQRRVGDLYALAIGKRVAFEWSDRHYTPPHVVVSTREPTLTDLADPTPIKIEKRKPGRPRKPKSEAENAA